MDSYNVFSISLRKMVALLRTLCPLRYQQYKNRSTVLYSWVVIAYIVKQGRIEAGVRLTVPNVTI